MSAKPILGITMGDPAGVGPEVTARVFADKKIYDLCRPLVIADAEVMQKAIKVTHGGIKIEAISAPTQAKFEPGIMDVYDLKNVEFRKLPIGKISVLAGNAAFGAIKKAIELAMSKQIDGIVTNPIHKESLNLAGHHFAGHTEILAHFTSSKNVGMLLAFGNLRIVHVSTHVSLRQACELVKKERILNVIKMLHEACKQLGIDSPRIAVAGLNPHASDGGLFGTEEAEEIIPAIAEAKKMGLNVEGPIPPDTMFPKAKAGVYDGCVAMYHDQGHIAFKFETFQWDKEQQKVKSVRGVNITLGLPIIRTSVDHGTAFDIAWQGLASTETLMDAVEYAAKLAINKRQ